MTRKNKWKEQTRTHFLNNLSGLFSWAIKRGWIDFNPVKMVPRKTGDALRNARRFVLTPQTLKKLLTILELEMPVHDAVLIAASTGLRFSNIRGLKWRDIDIERGTFFIEAERMKANADFEAPIHPELLEVFSERARTQGFVIGKKIGSSSKVRRVLVWRMRSTTQTSLLVVLVTRTATRVRLGRG